MKPRFSRRFLIVGAMVVAALAAGTTGFTVIEKYPLLDAFYMTLTTITTVGYMEVHPLSPAGRVFNCFLILFGVTTIFVGFGAVTQTIIEMQLGDVINKRRMKRMIEKLKDHYIVCGFGRVGRGAAAELQSAGVPFLVVDRSPEKAESAIRAGMLAATADSTRDETLREAGIERAKGVVAALETDSDNLYLVLSAKALNPNVRIAARASEEESVEKLQRVGAEFVFTPYNVTGHRLALALMRPSVFEFLSLTTKSIGLDVAIEEVKVHEGSEFVSQSLRQMQLRRDIGVIVLAIRKPDGQMLFNPPAEAELEGNDTLIAMGDNDSLKRLEKMLHGERS
jgi:voltage-gated potassium channel